MKKFGFTLAEILLSLAIIGIVAAVTAPTLINIMPNKNKMLTLKYQKIITEINADLLNNRGIYIDGKFDKELPGNVEKVLEIGDALHTNKYSSLLMHNLELDENYNTSVSDTTTSFKTADGVLWTVITDSTNTPTNIHLDINGDVDGPNAAGSASLTNPDRILFGIDKETGRAICDSVNDPITCRYIKCPYYMNNKKLDYDCISSDSGDCSCKK